jgi:DNA-directed RNA polymerase specialized sigma24 family protein
MTQPPAPDGTSKDDTDSPLVAACLNANQRAWDQLYKQYNPWLLLLAGRLLGGRARQDLVEDIAANVWFALVEAEGLRGFDPQRGSLAGYLSALVRRQVQRHRRLERSCQPHVLLGTGERLADPASLSGASILLWDDFEARLSPAEQRFLQAELFPVADDQSTKPLSDSYVRKLRQRVRAKLLSFLQLRAAPAASRRR